jgi:uncharacterized membrane protein YfcA
LGFITWITCALVVMLASATQALTGFGFPLVAVPFFILIFDPKWSVGLSMSLSFISLFVLLMTIRKDTDWQRVKVLLSGALLGLPFGIYVFSIINVKVLKICISMVVLTMCIVNLNNYTFPIKPENVNKWFRISGILSGFLNATVGMPGPPTIILMSNFNIEKNYFRATLVAYFLLIYCFTIPSMILVGTLSLEIFKIAVYLIPFPLLGMYLGKFLFNKIPNELFKKVVLVFLLIVTGYSIVTNLI